MEEITEIFLSNFPRTERSKRDIKTNRWRKFLIWKFQPLTEYLLRLRPNFNQEWKLYGIIFYRNIQNIFHKTFSRVQLQKLKDKRKTGNRISPMKRFKPSSTLMFNSLSFLITRNMRIIVSPIIGFQLFQYWRVVE